MRVIRASFQNKVFYAALLDKEVQPLNTNLGIPETIALDALQILPLVLPSKIVCVGLNYHAHAQEMGLDIPEEPLLFFKPPSAVIGTGETIRCPEQSSEVHYEGELAIIMGKECKDLTPEQVPGYIFGYTCANDVTARDLQKKDGLYARAKGFDTFCPLGPWIETEIQNPDQLEITVKVNGQVRQEGNTSDMITPPFALVSFISTIMTLAPGDVILTGTPPGVGALCPGDEVEVSIGELGALINKVA